MSRRGKRSGRLAFSNRLFIIIRDRMETLSSDCSWVTLLLHYSIEINFLVLKHLEKYADRLPSLEVLKEEMVGSKSGLFNTV